MAEPLRYIGPFFGVRTALDVSGDDANRAVVNLGAAVWLTPRPHPREEGIMQTLLRLYAYDPRICACEERIIYIRYDPTRTIAPLDESFFGQIKRWWTVRRER